MNIDSLTLAQVKQVAGMFAAADATVRIPVPVPDTTAKDHGLSIVVLDRGFVYIGYATTDTNWCHIQSAKCIRRWGTERGLGQLANDGPQTETKLDDAGNVAAPMRAVIHILEVKADKWTRLFSR